MIIKNFRHPTCTWSSSVTGSLVLVDLSAVFFLFAEICGIALESPTGMVEHKYTGHILMLCHCLFLINALFGNNLFLKSKKM